MAEQKPATLEELRDLIEEGIALAEENQKLLKAMRRDALIAGTLKAVFWVIVIGGSLYFVSQFLAPYLGILESMGPQGSGADLNTLINEYRSFLGY